MIISFQSTGLIHYFILILQATRVSELSPPLFKSGTKLVLQILENKTLMNWREVPEKCDPMSAKRQGNCRFGIEVKCSKQAGAPEMFGILKP